MRIRTIKPEFWLHEGLCSLSEFSRLLAIALLNWADDEGYFMANPTLIRGQVFPFLEDSKKIPGSLQDLSRVGWIRLGEDDQGRAVGFIVNFHRHQRVDKPRSSTIKDSSQFQEDSRKPPRTIQEDSTEEWNGKEKEKEKEKEGNGEKSPTAHDLLILEDTNTKPPTSKAKGTLEELKAYAQEIGCPASDGEFMFDHWTGNGWKKGSNPVKDWRAGIRAWRAQSWLPSQKPGATKPATSDPSRWLR